MFTVTEKRILKIGGRIHERLYTFDTLAAAQDWADYCVASGAGLPGCICEIHNPAGSLVETVTESDCIVLSPSRMAAIHV